MLLWMALVCLAPWLFPSSAARTLLGQMGIAILICQSYQLLLGQGGMLSFGHAIYVGAGSFLAIHSLKWIGDGVGWLPVALVPLLAGLAGLGLAALLGWITTRRAGTPLAMISLGLGELVWAAAVMWPQGSGGEGGLSANRVVGPPLLGFNLASPLQMYGLIAVYASAGTLLLAGFVRTPLGRLLNAVRDNAERVAFLGYDPHGVRYLAFMLSGFLAGVAGGLSALTFEIFTTDMLGAERSGSYLLFTVLGGSAWLLGPVLGGVLMVLSLSLLSAHSPAWLLYLGVLFMGVVMFVPGGLAPWLSGRLRAIARPMPWPRRISQGLRALALGCVGAGLVLGIEMSYHLPQLAVQGPVLKRFGWVVNVQTATPWLLCGLMVVGGCALAGWLQRRESRTVQGKTSP